MSRADRWRAALPVLLLLAVAANQIRLTRSKPLSPWKGGGFGMFSTTDGLGARRLRVVVHGPERDEELAVPTRLRKYATQAELLPDGPRLERLARALAEAESREGRPVETVEVEVFRTTYARASLFASERLLERFEYRHAAPHAE